MIQISENDSAQLGVADAALKMQLANAVPFQHPTFEPYSFSTDSVGGVLPNKTLAASTANPSLPSRRCSSVTTNGRQTAPRAVSLFSSGNHLY